MFEGCIFGIPTSNYPGPNYAVLNKANARTGIEIGKKATSYRRRDSSNLRQICAIDGSLITSIAIRRYFCAGFRGAGKVATRDAPPIITTYLYCNVGGLHLSLYSSTCFESNIPRSSGMLPTKLEISSALSKCLEALATGRIMRFIDARSQDKRD